MGEVTTEAARTTARDWARAHWDPELTVAEWWRLLAAAGYAAPMLPEAQGGRGYARDLAMAANAGLAEVGVVGPPMGLGLMLAAPTIAAHGTPEQHAQFLPRILDGTDAWCQLFSEPGAGSDLAGLQTKAVRDGDEYVITGQKVWTSGGQVADWGMLIARTDSDAPKHKGITYFAFPMHQPGVEVRPLREMTGRAMFNEVFLTEARVSAANVIGQVDEGWAVANTTLVVERASIGAGGNAGLGVAIPGSVVGHRNRRAGDFIKERSSQSAGSFGPGTAKRFAALAKQQGVNGDPVIRQGLAQLHTLTALNQWNTLRARTNPNRTGVEGNLAKLLLTTTLRLARQVGNEIIGAEGMLWGEDSLSEGAIQELTVFSPGPAIYGGTDQIQRNITSERGLGLPREPGDQAKLPFNQLPKNG